MPCKKPTRDSTLESPGHSIPLAILLKPAKRAAQLLRSISITPTTVGKDELFWIPVQQTPQGTPGILFLDYPARSAQAICPD
jgi:hypothetical protein